MVFGTLPPKSAIPFFAAPTLVIVCDVLEPSGEPYSRDPRSIAKKAEAFVKSAGVGDVAYFGPEATFTHQAALRSFGRGSAYVPMRTIADVFAEVDKGRADYGVVPIENSTEGVVNHTLDMFIDSRLSVCAELELPIQHYLLGHAKTYRGGEGVTTLFSHYQPLAQCRQWLESHLPGVRVVEASSTSEAARLAADGSTKAKKESEAARKGK